MDACRRQLLLLMPERYLEVAFRVDDVVIVCCPRGTWLPRLLGCSHILDILHETL